jgi:hypothetical protein
VRSIGNVAKDAKIRAAASGALSNGDTVIVNSDGTVSSVFSNLTIFNDALTFVPAIATDGSGTFLILYRDSGDSNKGKAVAGTISGSSVTLGSPVEVTAEMGNSEQSTSVIYDPDNSKFVIAYRDDNNSNYLTSRVATVTGTTTSLGTAVVIDSQNVTTVDLTYDTSANKVVCGWRGGPSTLVAGAVGTVSGTSISFGSTATVASKRPNYISIVYDSNANKTAFFYRDDADTRDGYYVVCTVSGTSISGGTTAAFNAADTGSISATYDSTAQKIVIAYQDTGNNDYGSVRVGTISGTSMSFGTEVNFSGTSYVGDVAAQYDSASNKTFIIYDKADSALTAVLGTVSGTSISIGSENTLSSGNASYTSAAFSDGADKVLVVFRNNANSNKGTLLTVDTNFEGGNLTSDNFIGFSDSGYLSGQNVGVDSTCSVNREQTGLTAGEKYYVQLDGSLSTTPDTPSVEAGTAISSTEILVKG